MKTLTALIPPLLLAPLLLASGVAAALGLHAPDPLVDGRDYVITSHGAPRTFDAMIAELGSADVVFIGEEHDQTMGHALEMAILQGLSTHTAPRALSLEMFERDVQLVLDEYLAGHITEASFLQAARPWPNYKTDYRPLVEFCKANGIPVDR